MAKDEKTFADLVKDAPSGAETGTVTVVGLLAKSDDPKKFVLHLQGGRSHTVDTAAVKKHTVLGHSVGHAVVQLEIDRESLPAQTDQPHAQLSIGAYGGPFTSFVDHISNFWSDVVAGSMSVRPLARGRALADNGTRNQRG